MADPTIFPESSPRFGLPMLWSGQAQKEYFVNEAHALIDSLLHCVIEGKAPSPPINPAEGECWLVDDSPTGAWLGQAGRLALRQGGNWLFAAPRDGLRVHNRSLGQDQRYLGAWIAPQRPLPPSGGLSVDAEARTAIAAILSCLSQAGIISSN
jgi:Protein of unknown function (DUF2793)